MLGFTYPTVYQGWQTLVGAFILLYLRPSLLTPNEDVNKLTCLNFLKIFPSLLLYVGSLVCGSKALASIPIPLYVCAQNTYSLCFLLCSLKSVPFFDFVIALTGLISSLFLFFYVGFIEPYGYHPWPIFFIIISTALELINVANESSREISRLYYRNIFSFVILMPCSLYLGEAFSALQFKYLDQIGFYSGCIVSGISGIFLQLFALKLTKRRQHHMSSALIRLPTLLLSALFFDNNTIPSPLWLLIGVQILSTIIFTYNSYSMETKLNSQESLI